MGVIRRPLYNVGDLLVEVVDGIYLSTGIISDFLFDNTDDDYVYSIIWSDMAVETQIFESIIKWRIQNSIFMHYKTVE